MFEIHWPLNRIEFASEHSNVHIIWIAFAVTVAMDVTVAVDVDGHMLLALPILLFQNSIEATSNNLEQTSLSVWLLGS